MGYGIQQGNTSQALEFLLVLSSDHITGATGKTPTVTLRKSGQPFAAPVGAITEIGNGLYQVAASPSDANILGPLWLHATAFGCDPRDDTFQVVNYNPTGVRPVSPTAVGTVSVPVRTILVDMFAELGFAAGEAIAAADMQLALGKINRLFDNWNANRAAVWASSFLTETLVPNLSPHTIGPISATWTVDQRPVEIVGANLVFLGTNPNINTRITIRDAQWYLGLTVPTLATTWPTDLYYQPDWPNGNCFFYPVPTTAYQVQLLTRVTIGNVTLEDTFWMPPGYRDAATLTLAEMCANPFSQVLSPSVVAAASRARAAIFANNDVTPRLATQDAGMPTGAPTRSNWNYLSGMLTK